jgi:hypothetical protein
VGLICFLALAGSNKSGVMGQLCRIIRHLQRRRASETKNWRAPLQFRLPDSPPGRQSQKYAPGAALRIVDHLRCSFASFKSTAGRTRCGELGAHLLQARTKRFDLVLLLRDRSLEFLR